MSDDDDLYASYVDILRPLVPADFHDPPLLAAYLRDLGQKVLRDYGRPRPARATPRPRSGGDDPVVTLKYILCDRKNPVKMHDLYHKAKQQRQRWPTGVVAASARRGMGSVRSAADVGQVQASRGTGADETGGSSQRRLTSRPEQGPGGSQSTNHTQASPLAELSNEQHALVDPFTQEIVELPESQVTLSQFFSDLRSRGLRGQVKFPDPQALRASTERIRQEVRAAVRKRKQEERELRRLLAKGATSDANPRLRELVDLEIEVMAEREGITQDELADRLRRTEDAWRTLDEAHLFSEILRVLVPQWNPSHHEHEPLSHHAVVDLQLQLAAELSNASSPMVGWLVMDGVIADAARFTRDSGEALNRCETYHVADDVCELIAYAAATLQSVPLEPDLLHTTSGFALFDVPLPMPDNLMPLAALHWRPIHSSDGIDTQGLWIWPFECDDTGMISPSSPSNWAWGLSWETEDTAGQSVWAIRYLLTLMLFLRQEVLIVPHERVFEKRGQARPAGNSRQPPDILVVQLRRRRELTPNDSQEPREFEWSHQWIVRGHWRQQWYPSRKRNEPKWIETYVKGPTDKPLVVKRRIYSVSR